MLKNCIVYIYIYTYYGLIYIHIYIYIIHYILLSVVLLLSSLLLVYTYNNICIYIYIHTYMSLFSMFHFFGWWCSWSLLQVFEEINTRTYDRNAFDGLSTFQGNRAHREDAKMASSLQLRILGPTCTCFQILPWLRSKLERRFAKNTVVHKPKKRFARKGGSVKQVHKSYKAIWSFIIVGYYHFGSKIPRSFRGTPM